jgi:hypothetical protein
MRDNSSQPCWSSFGYSSRFKYPDEIVNGYILDCKIKGVHYPLKLARGQINRLSEGL